MTAPTYTEAVGRLAEASAQLAAFAEQQGTPRGETAAALAAEVTHAVTTDPEAERRRERMLAEITAHQAEAAAYIAGLPQLQEELAAFVDRFAALADELVALVAVPLEMDRRGTALAQRAQHLGEPFAAPQVFEDTVYTVRRGSDDGFLWTRLLHAGRLGRVQAAQVLSECLSTMRRT